MVGDERVARVLYFLNFILERELQMMETEQLKESVKQILKNTEKYDEMVDQARKVIIEYTPTFMKRFLFLIFFLTVLSVGQAFSPYYSTSLSFNFGMKIAIPVCLVLYIIIRIRAHKRGKASILQSDLMIKEADKFLDDALQGTELPRGFCNTEAMRRFEYYLDNHIAENLKECANLYYKETENSKLHQEMQELRESVNSATDAAYLAASEASAARFEVERASR